jgi:hypothetical protein
LYTCTSLERGHRALFFVLRGQLSSRSPAKSHKVTPTLPQSSFEHAVRAAE